MHEANVGRGCEKRGKTSHVLGIHRKIKNHCRISIDVSQVRTIAAMA